MVSLQFLYFIPTVHVVFEYFWPHCEERTRARASLEHAKTNSLISLAAVVMRGIFPIFVSTSPSQLYSTFTVWTSEDVPYGRIWTIYLCNNNSRLWKQIQMSYLCHFLYKWCHMKPDIFRIIFWVPSGIMVSSSYCEWYQQAGTIQRMDKASRP